MESYQAAGCEAVLVGETLMRSDNPARTIRELLALAPLSSAATRPALSSATHEPLPVASPVVSHVCCRLPTDMPEPAVDRCPPSSPSSSVRLPRHRRSCYLPPTAARVPLSPQSCQPPRPPRLCPLRRPRLSLLLTSARQRATRVCSPLPCCPSTMPTSIRSRPCRLRCMQAASPGATSLCRAAAAAARQLSRLRPISSTVAAPPRSGEGVRSCRPFPAP